MLPIKDEQLLAELEDVLRSMPPLNAFGRGDMDLFAWVGRALAVIHRWDPARAALLTNAADELGDDNMHRVSTGYRDHQRTRYRQAAERPPHVGPGIPHIAREQVPGRPHPNAVTQPLMLTVFMRREDFDRDNEVAAVILP